MYAGLIPIDMRNTSRALYFVFQPTVGAPVDEITIWLNGGPGKFEIEIGLYLFNIVKAAVPWKASFKKMEGSYGHGVKILKFVLYYCYADYGQVNMHPQSILTVGLI